MLDWIQADATDPRTPSDNELPLSEHDLDQLGDDVAAEMMLSGAVSSELDAFWCAVMSPSSDLDVLNDASAQPAEAEAPRRRHSAAVTTKDVKPRRAAPTAAKARLRSYERRSRSKREVSGR